MWAHPSAGNIARQWAAAAPGAHLPAHTAAALQPLLHLLHQLLQLQLLQGRKEEGHKGRQEWWGGDGDIKRVGVQWELNSAIVAT